MTDDVRKLFLFIHHFLYLNIPRVYFVYQTNDYSESSIVCYVVHNNNIKCFHRQS